MSDTVKFPAQVTSVTLITFTRLLLADALKVAMFVALCCVFSERLM